MLNFYTLARGRSTIITSQAFFTGQRDLKSLCFPPASSKPNTPLPEPGGVEKGPISFRFVMI